MQLLTIDEHKAKTARERSSRSKSLYSSTKSYYESATSSNNEEPTTWATYSRTDTNGRLLYKGSWGREYYLSNNGNRVYVTSNTQTYTSSAKTSISTSPYYLTPSYSSPSSSSTPSTPSRVIHTGPRGGKYYINSSGNKTYIKK